MTMTLTTPERLIGELAARRDTAAHAARDVYRRLLTDGADSPDAAAALEAAAATLAKSPETMAADVAAIGQAKRLRETVKRGEVPQADIQGAARALESHQDETALILKARRHEFARLMDAQRELGLRVDEGRLATSQLERLAKLHPGVLDGPPAFAPDVVTPAAAPAPKPVPPREVEMSARDYGAVVMLFREVDGSRGQGGLPYPGSAVNWTPGPDDTRLYAWPPAWAARLAVALRHAAGLVPNQVVTNPPTPIEHFARRAKLLTDLADVAAGGPFAVRVPAEPEN